VGHELHSLLTSHSAHSTRTVTERHEHQTYLLGSPTDVLPLLPVLAFFGVDTAESEADTLEAGVLAFAFVSTAALPPTAVAVSPPPRTVVAGGGVVDGVLGGTLVLAAVAVSPPPPTVVTGGGVVDGVLGGMLVLAAVAV